MKVSITTKNAAALHQALAATKDPELIQLRDRIDRYLKGQAEGGPLTADELDLIGELVAEEVRAPLHFMQDSQQRWTLKAALPKLLTFARKARAREEGGD